ncbi:hypothetical protein BT96DRAFT_162266 [Gymnopus androsaceus JB14]|uniref:Uncharacterized protein n=1 Tax=Gymnopus androsaceus JB14 TaxID=1447944 RepID=A0A6A4GBR3_9AGAR|nr:hypothetical protein BT96DRAFT_162266 [Gymnopus androsaceus JB14]
MAFFFTVHTFDYPTYFPGTSLYGISHSMAHCVYISYMLHSLSCCRGPRQKMDETRRVVRRYWY